MVEFIAEGPFCICGPDSTGEAPDYHPECWYHGEIEEEEDVNYGTCPWYQKLLNPDGSRQICSFGCYSEPACQTMEPEEGWPGFEHLRDA